MKNITKWTEFENYKIRTYTFVSQTYMLVYKAKKREEFACGASTCNFRWSQQSQLDTHPCIFGFKSTRSFHCANLVVLHEEIKGETNSHPCISKNSVVCFFFLSHVIPCLCLWNFGRISCMRKAQSCLIMEHACLHFSRRKFDHWEF